MQDLPGLLHVRKDRRAGFSLFEVAIVLTIFGLIVGGVTLGNDLIRAGQLSKLAGQGQRITASTQRFIDKYNALPGDMKNATLIWGKANDGAMCVASTLPQKTCDGNGNNKIEGNTSSPVTGTFTVEWMRFWQHLSNAGYLEDEYYQGVAAGIGSTTRDAVWLVFTDDMAAGFPALNKFNGIYGNSLLYVANYKANEIAGLDAKMDDGMPATGKLVLGNFINGIDQCTDTNSASNLSAKYKGTTASCGFILRQQF